MDVPIKIQSKNYHDKQWKEFTVKYITTEESIELVYSLEKIVIKLGSSMISIPHFRSTVTVLGMNKQFVTGGTAYLSLLRAPLRRKIEFTFNFGAFFGSKFCYP